MRKTQSAGGDVAEFLLRDTLMNLSVCLSVYALTHTFLGAFRCG